MDFTKLEESDLNEFLSIDYGIELDSKLSLVDQAEYVFDHLKSYPHTTFPLPVIDLYLASQYLGPRNVTYTYDQVMNLTDDQIKLFASIFQFNPSTRQNDLNRIYRILSYLDLIVNPKLTLLQPTVVQKLCDELSITDLNNFRLAYNLDQLNCQVPVHDPQGYITNVNIVSKLTETWIESIETHGSGKLLLYSVENCNFPLTKFLLQYGVNKNYQDEQGNTGLILAAKSGCIEIVKFLIQNGADPNIGHNQIPTVLHYIARTGNLELIRHMVEYGADPSINDHVKRSPIFYAAARGHLEIVKYLVNQGGNINQISEIGESVLNVAARSDNLQLIKYLIKSGLDINHLDQYGTSPLREAVSRGNIEISEYLISSGAQIDIDNHLGENVLFNAVANNQAEMVKYLISKGSNVNSQNRNGETVLMIAIKKLYLDIVIDLLQFGADPRIQNNNGQSSISYAEQYQNTNLTNLLNRYI